MEICWLWKKRLRSCKTLVGCIRLIIVNLSINDLVTRGLRFNKEYFSVSSLLFERYSKNQEVKWKKYSNYGDNRQ